MNEPLLQVKNYSVSFNNLKVTDKVNFFIDEGEFFSLVGESGCGKTITAMGLLHLLPFPSAKIEEGNVFLKLKDNQIIDLTTISNNQMTSIRGSEVGCIFQEPMQALNPVLSIKKQLMEVFRGKAIRKKEAENLILFYLEKAGFKNPHQVLQSYPHELSGGMLQRVCIVMALLLKPRLIIADEPTTALDVTVQAQVLSILKELAETSKTAVLLITHNMGIVSEYAHRMAVMYAGRVVESGLVKDILKNPLHPYTQGLLDAIPTSHTELESLKFIPGHVPSPQNYAEGCRFYPRCSLAKSLKILECSSEKIPPCYKEDSHEVYCYGRKNFSTFTT